LYSQHRDLQEYITEIATHLLNFDGKEAQRDSFYYLHSVLECAFLQMSSQVCAMQPFLLDWSVCHKCTHWIWCSLCLQAVSYPDICLLLL